MPLWQPFLEAKVGLDGKIAIVGIPWDGSSSFRSGMRHAPDAIRVASDSIESYSHVFQVDLRHIDLVDLGNMLLPHSAEEAINAISTLVFKLHKDGKKTVCIGGDHSITIGVVDGLLKAHRRLQVIVFDAHSDWRDEYNGSKFSHACTVRRLSELVGMENLFVFGVRSFFGYEPMELYRDLNELAWLIASDVPTHVSVDLDVIDPSVIPAVGNPEPGGLQFCEFVRAIQRLHTIGCKVVSVDLVELCPQHDTGASAVTAAKLAVECMLGLLASSV
ncbi:MAG: agmatinase [Armatimonadota bacterium]|nr:agmatinase [Armatimonadota bacterium]MCX7776666.1 agmatinase [Armatimonadota bacterium]MDW8025719.1 agmatinase [Armatimonadota bacterium]